MENTIVIIIFGMFLISCVSAYNLTAGESYNFTLSESYDYYSIIGNSTPIDLNITQEGNIVTITLGKYTKSDIFEIIFFNAKEEIIHHHHGFYVENKTIEYFPNYVDREVYVEKNETINDEEIESEISFLFKIICLCVVGGGVLIYFFLREPKNIGDKANEKGEESDDKI